MPPVMRETDRKIIDDRKVLIQCPKTRVFPAMGDPSCFCGGLITIEVPAKTEYVEGKCERCGWPGAVRVQKDGRWIAYVAVL